MIQPVESLEITILVDNDTDSLSTNFGVVGGFHLAGPTEATIPETVDALEAFDLQLIAPAHCTGWWALGQLDQRFGDRVIASSVGKRFVL